VSRWIAVLVAALVAVPVAGAREKHQTLSELERDVMCPVCGTTLDQSNSPAAEQIKRLIARRIAAGDTRTQIENTLVAEYGDAILAAPRKKGFGLLAWWLPIAGIVTAAVVVGVGAWRWSRAHEPELPDPGIDRALERRLDDELARFD
jgi:cytochrome c-type biogenesis protein CcmH